MVNDEGDRTSPLTCWRKGRGRTGTTYRINIVNSNRLRRGTEKDPGLSGRMGGLRRTRIRRRESLGCESYQNSTEVATTTRVRDKKREGC